jgi:hypothetical protein
VTAVTFGWGTGLVTLILAIAILVGVVTVRRSETEPGVEYDADEAAWVRGLR